MLSSWPIARTSVAGRRGRTALLIAAVGLASSLVTAVSCAIGSLQQTVADRIERALGTTDARIIHEFNARFDAAIVGDVRTWPGVQLAEGRLFASITLVKPNPDGSVTDAPRANVNVRGVELSGMERFQQVELAEGRLPRDDRELLLDPLAASTLHAGLGDRLRLQRFGPPLEFEVVGIYKRPVLGMLQRPEGQLSLAATGEATGRTNEVSVVSIILDDDLDVRQWCAANAGRLAPPLQLEPAEMAATGFDRQVRASRLGFVLGAAIAFLSCSFIVATGMTTAVVEQERMMAVVRCIGGSRRQLFMAQVLAGTIVCGIGGAIGVPLGMGLAWLVLVQFPEQIPGGLTISWLGVALSLAGALLAGVLGSAFPAWRACRVSPLRALAARSAPPSRHGFVLATFAGLLCVGIQLALLGIPDVQARFWVYASVGIPLQHIGWFLLAVPVLRILLPGLAPLVSSALHLPPRLLRESMAATPFRNGFTAGALMVGMSVLVSTWSGGESLMRDWFDRIRFADGFAFRMSGLSPDEQATIAALPFVRETAAIGYLPLRVGAEQQLGVQGMAPPSVVCVGFEAEPFFRLNRLDWQQGTPEEAIPALRAGEGVLVAEQFLAARGLGVGDTISLGSARTERPFRIVGVVGAAGLDIATQWFGIRSAYMEQAVSCVFMDFDVMRRLYGAKEATIVQMNLDPGTTDEAVMKAVEDAVPGVRYASGRAIRAAIDEIGRTLLGVTSTVAFAALVLGCFGVGNVIAAGIHSRRFEFGILRAVGAPPSLLLRLIVGEAILIGFAAVATGSALGMSLAWNGTRMHRDLLGLPLRPIFPVAPALIGAAVLVAMAALAALPAAIALARRPARELLAAGRG
ncbi:MAG: ABC transporter permease [Phycisphaerales bacterium]|nr:ABC transporter permease [Phycisphaerales bacterium]